MMFMFDNLASVYITALESRHFKTRYTTGNGKTASMHIVIEVSKGAKIRSRYNQVPHPTQDTNGKVTNSQLDTTNESQEVSPFPAGDHKAHINRHAQMFICLTLNINP